MQLIRYVTKPIHKLYKRAPHIEHFGFVSLAAVEVFHLPGFLLWVNVTLLGSGLCAVFLETFHFMEDEI